MNRQSDSSDGSVAATGPLTDIRVVDLTQMLAGPYATMLLADLGADVVKVEPPRGDMTRDTPPHLEEGEAYGGYFQSVNRNKRSLALDLKSDEGIAVFEQLVERADIVVENFRARTMERLGLSYETLEQINPQIIYASIRGFGDPDLGRSPYADRPAFDLIAQAMGGIMSITGTEENGPTKVGPGVGDIFPAVLCVVGVLSALHHRERSGEGQHVDVGMVDGILSLCERIVHQYSFTGEVPRQQGNTHPLLFPFNRFEASDGYVVIAAPTETQWENLCEHMDRPELIDEYADEADRQRDSDRLRSIINDWTRQHSKDALFEKLADDVPCGPVNTAEDIFEDEHFEARNMLPSVEHADTGQQVQVAGQPIKLSNSASGVCRRAPLLGEHSRDVLQESGFTAQEVAPLLDEGVVFTSDDA